MYFDFKSPIVVRRLLKLCLNEEDNIFTIEEATEFNRFVEQLASEYSSVLWRIKDKAEREAAKTKEAEDEVPF